ncbi:amidohydrolase family protein [Muricoccus radiodurans]|uniref:amidohydrolase family protein n=1 Tax=Muricoccus radiodurans TaxID=2231721 RepID=UPI003CFA5B15
MSMTRRGVVAALGTVAAGAARAQAPAGRVFDCHLHIIDPRYPLVENQGYLPPPLTWPEYETQARPLGITGGAVVSGSFHGFDQSYLRAVLGALGPEWVGVTQVPNDIPDEAMADLARARVRALRFNVFRGRIDSVDDIVATATRAHAAAGWHPEIYADAAALAPHADKLAKLPSPIVIDHLGMTERGLPVVLDLVAAGAKVKATGFGRVDMNVPRVLEAIAARDPSALMFGTDIPSTRARRPFEVADLELVRRVLGAELAERVLWRNGAEKYRIGQAGRA